MRLRNECQKVLMFVNVTHKRPVRCLMHCHLADVWDDLPNKVKNYIADIEQRADPAGECQDRAFLLDLVDSLMSKLKELEEESGSNK